jgi:hypothetical protein
MTGSTESIRDIYVHDRINREYQRYIHDRINREYQRYIHDRIN